MEFCYKPASIRKMWVNWLRNKDERDFSIVFKEKVEAYSRKMNRLKKTFVPHQVGYIEVNYHEPSYCVHLIGQNPYRVFWADEFTIDEKLMKLANSLEKFCKAQSVQLIQSGTPNTLIIETVFSNLTS